MVLAKLGLAAGKVDARLVPVGDLAPSVGGVERHRELIEDRRKAVADRERGKRSVEQVFRLAGIQHHDPVLAPHPRVPVEQASSGDVPYIYLWID
jgi:hypothetical protein